MVGRDQRSENQRGSTSLMHSFVQAENAAKDLLGRVELVLSEWKPLTFPEEGRIMAWDGTVIIPGTSEWESECYAKMDSRICLYKAPRLSH